MVYFGASDSLKDVLRIFLFFLLFGITMMLVINIIFIEKYMNSLSTTDPNYGNYKKLKNFSIVSLIIFIFLNIYFFVFEVYKKAFSV